MSILGAIDWQTEVSGFCRCPGEAFHTSGNGKKDCRVNVDGAPTIFCFHASCAAAVAEANRKLRRELGAGSWEIRLPGGQVLRSGDLLKCRVQSAECRTEIVRREVLEEGRRAAECAPYLYGDGALGRRRPTLRRAMMAERRRRNPARTARGNGASNSSRIPGWGAEGRFQDMAGRTGSPRCNTSPGPRPPRWRQ
jgi:hypothetical protein